MPFDMLTCRLDHEEDADIIEFLKQATAKGFSKSYIVKTAIRHYAGILSQISGEEGIDKALLRVIQLEKKFNDFVAKQEERYLKLMDLVQEEVEQSRIEREEMRRELEFIKQVYEQKLKEKEEEEKRKKEEEERKRKEELQRLIKKKFEHYSECARYGGLTFEQRIRLPKEIKELARDYGLTEEEVKAMVLAQFSNLKTYLEEGSRCPRLF